LKLTFNVSEGRRLAISGIFIEGNEHVSDADIVAAMGTRPEGFLWVKDGEFDEIAFASDLSDSIPALYASRGFIDMRVVSDTLIVDPDLGKGMIVITVEEGPRYLVNNFDIVGNRYFQSAEIQPLYPFRERTPSLGSRMAALLGRDAELANVYDQNRWISATRDLLSMYSNEGFMEATIDPVIERVRGADSSHMVNLRWDIRERQQSIVNRIDITGNSFTRESCIRQQLTVFPGSVFSQDRLMQSLQRIQAMGFF
jgi:outer membrane protein insertion porin family